LPGKGKGREGGERGREERRKLVSPHFLDETYAPVSPFSATVALFCDSVDMA